MPGQKLINVLFTAGIVILQPAASFNYEERTTYTLTFSVQDQYLVGLERKDLTINITNVNEAPTIYITEGIISFDEDTVMLFDSVFLDRNDSLARIEAP